MTTICSQVPASSAGFARERAPRRSDRLGRIRTTLNEWGRRIHDRRELAGLDDRMLNDIGISRAEALFLASKPFWRE